MKQKIKQTLMVIVGLLLSTTAFAHDFEVDGIYYNIIDETNKTVRVTYKGNSYNSYSNEYTGAVTIPSSVTYNSTTYSVTSIGFGAFRDCDGLTSVTIPNSVTWINNGAFFGCTGLTSITIPNSVTSIDYDAFYGCTGLTKVTIPNSVTSIGYDAFYNCTGLTSVTIPNSVTTIGSDAFSGCSGLTEVNITDLSAWCKIDFGNSYANPLYYAKKLKLNGTEIKDLVIPNDITEIKFAAFYNCSGLTSVTIPNSVTSIGKSAFCHCPGLTSVTIPNSVTSIGDYAFSYCDGLTSVTIPNSVTSIGYRAFYDCTGLTELIIEDGKETLSLGYNDWASTYTGEGLFYDCPLEKLYLGRNLSYETSNRYGYSPFYRKTTLKEVTIGNSVTSIGERAFEDCDGLTEVNFNAENCTSMGSSSYPVFKGCTNLKALNIGNSVKTIPNYAFRGCTGLTSVTIGNSVTTIGESAFYNCSGLTSVTIPNSVTSIGESAFYNCSGLTSVTIPNSITSIGDDAFEGCSGLTSVTIGNSVTEIGYKAFSGCTGLTEATIGNSVTTIGSSAFENCSGLTSVTIPNSVTTIGYRAFDGCSGLTSVTIPNSVTLIGNYAFDYCTGLTSVTLGNSVTSIGNYAFDYCYNLKTIVSLNPTPPTCASSNSFYSNNYSNATLYVPKDSYAKYFIDEVWGKFSNIKKIETTATSISLNKSSLTLDKGATETIKATITPNNTTLSFLYWTSDNPIVATVDQSGKITAISAGTAKITAMAIDGSNVSASCNVTVNAVETRIVLSQTEATLPVNDIMTLTYTVANSTNKTATWSTSNANVAPIKVNSDGSVTVVGMSDGVATITATANDGSGASASCVVTVGVGGIEGVEVDDNAIEVARYDIHGRLLSEPTRGINIVKMSDGTTRKEIIK